VKNPNGTRTFQERVAISGAKSHKIQEGTSKILKEGPGLGQIGTLWFPQGPEIVIEEVLLGFVPSRTVSRRQGLTVETFV
jgi:hypothetical protein